MPERWGHYTQTGWQCPRSFLPDVWQSSGRNCFAYQENLREYGDMKTRAIFSVRGVQVQLTQSGVVGTAVLWILFSLLVWWLVSPSLAAVLVFGLLLTLLHWLGEFLHQMGHALVARRVGYPMQRIRTWYVLAAGLYPKDEPPLPAEIHIRRALGGPAMSLFLSFISGVGAGMLWSSGGYFYYLVLFFALENFFVFFIGAFLPLGFTDGSTLLYWWPKRGQFSASDNP